MRRIMFLIFVLILIVPNISAQTGNFTYGDCPLDLPDSIVCGTLTVPENWDNPSGTQIQLAVAILFSDNPQADPVVYLEGGPGGATLLYAEEWLSSSILQNRDIILMDQRGTGYSQPFLGCYAEDDEEDFVAGIQTCRDDLLAQGIALDQYNSAASAKDFEALRNALGIQQWNLYGISYGTRLALTIMRDFPVGVRSTVIDSVYPPEVDANVDDTLIVYDDIMRLLAACAAQPACGSAFPDLANRFIAGLDAWNADPLVIYDEYYDEEVEITGDDMLNFLFESLYDTGTIPYLPLVIHAALEDDEATLTAIYLGEIFDEGSDVGSDDAEFDLETILDSMDDETLNAFLTDYEYASLDDLYDDMENLSDEDYEFMTLDAYFYAIPVDEFENALLAELGLDDADAMYDMLDNMSDDEYYDLVISVFLPDYYDEYASDGQGDDIESADGMFQSVECNEEFAFYTFADTEAALTNSDLPEFFIGYGLASAEDNFASCDLWGAGVANPIETQPVVSDIPTLVLTGEFDPVTPTAWGESAASYLSNSFLFEFPGAGHGVTTLPCAEAMMVAFLDNPAKEPDASCMASIGAPDFVISLDN